MPQHRDLTAWASILSAVCIWPATSWAFRVSPMIVSFAPRGNGTTQDFVLDNNGKDRIAVQIEALHRYIGLDGRETRTPTDEFNVYPQQVSLQPNEKREISVTWTGNHEPDRELAYRLVMTELPIHPNTTERREKKGGANITFLMQYVASLYVTPPGALPQIEVESFKLLPDGQGELIFKNAGTAHRVIKDPRVIFRLPSGKKIDAPQASLQDLEGENVLAQEERRFNLALPSAVVKAEKARPNSIVVSIELK